MAETKNAGTVSEAVSIFRAADPALPIVLPIGGGNTAVNTGLSKRELFAAMAMTNLACTHNGEAFNPVGMAKASVAYADALIAELAKGAGE